MTPRRLQPSFIELIGMPFVTAWEGVKYSIPTNANGKLYLPAIFWIAIPRMN